VCCFVSTFAIGYCVSNTFTSASHLWKGLCRNIRFTQAGRTYRSCLMLHLFFSCWINRDRTTRFQEASAFFHLTCVWDTRHLFLCYETYSHLSLLDLSFICIALYAWYLSRSSLVIWVRRNWTSHGKTLVLLSVNGSCLFICDTLLTRIFPTSIHVHIVELAEIKQDFQQPSLYQCPI
jgi:hypothetical protein